MLRSGLKKVGVITVAAVISLSPFQNTPISTPKNINPEPVVESAFESNIGNSFPNVDYSFAKPALAEPAISFDLEGRSYLEEVTENSIPRLSQATCFIRAIIQYTWCLPQTLSGWIYYTILKYSGELTESFNYNELIISSTPNMPNSSSMGRFIFMGQRFPQYREKLVLHEYGHVSQSYLFGPLQLPLVGLTDSIWWLYCKNQEKNNPSFSFDDTYWNFFTEKMANRLVGLDGKMNAGEEER